MRPDDWAPVYHRGVLAGQLNLWLELLRDFERAIALGCPDPRAWRFAALSAVIQGNVEDYRRICREMVTRFADSPDPWERGTPLRTLSIAPGAAEGVPSWAQTLILPGMAINLDDKLNRLSATLPAQELANTVNHIRIARSVLLMTACWLAVLALLANADEFSAVEHQRTTIYHSPQTPGFTSWCGAWTMQDGSLMVCFTQATGPVEGRPQAPKEVQHRLSWPPPGHPGYDMTGLDMRNVHLRSTDAGKSWKQVSADAFKSCMNGITGEAQTALADGTIVRGVWGYYLPYNPELPQTGYLERSTDGSQTWGKPELLLDPKHYSVWPKRIRLLRDGRLIVLGGVARVPANSRTRAEYNGLFAPLLMVSNDQGKSWQGPITVVPSEYQRAWGGEEFDAAELPNGDLLCVFRRADPEKSGHEVRWQGLLKKSGDTWTPGDVGAAPFPHSGHPELLATREGAVLHLATSGIHWTIDAGKIWHKLELSGTAYYPRAVQATDGRIFVFGHVGGDDAYGKSDQSIVMDSFRLKSKNTAARWKPHKVRRLASGATEQQIPARLQVVTEDWNRVVAVPYIVYMPEKDQLLMLVSCDYPHRPMVLTSDDRGASWSQPQPVLPDEPANARHLLGVSLTYLGDGKLLCGVEGKLRCRSVDYGRTWTSEPIPPNSHGGGWNQWDPYLVDREAASGNVIQLMETGYRGSTNGGQEAFLRSSRNLGQTWNDATRVPQWDKVSEVALVRAANGQIVAACRTDIPSSKQGETLDHFEGLGVSLSADEGHTWTELQKLFDWGRHHPSLAVMPTGEIVMTYVVRKGYIETNDGFPQFGIEAVVSRDHGQSWDLDHRYLLHTWVGNRKGSNQSAPGPQAWWASSQATSTVLLPDGNLLTAFGTGYRSQPNAQGMSSPRDVGLIQWRLSDKYAGDGTQIRDAAPDSDLRNWLDPLTGSPQFGRRHP